MNHSGCLAARNCLVPIRCGLATIRRSLRPLSPVRGRNSAFGNSAMAADRTASMVCRTIQANLTVLGSNCLHLQERDEPPQQGLRTPRLYRLDFSEILKPSRDSVGRETHPTGGWPLLTPWGSIPPPKRPFLLMRPIGWATIARLPRLGEGGLNAAGRHCAT